MVQNVKIHRAFNSTNKGIHHMVKGISLWDKEKYNIFTFLLDNDASLGNNVVGIKAIDTIFTKLYSW